MPTFSFVLRKYLFLSICTFCISIAVYSQPSNRTDTALTLDQCVDYALKHQPFINQAILNQDPSLDLAGTEQPAAPASPPRSG